jgi:hypothetical protein
MDKMIVGVTRGSIDFKSIDRMKRTQKEKVEKEKLSNVQDMQHIDLEAYYISLDIVN